MCSSPKRQRGVTLLVGLIMLVLMTMVAITAFNLGMGNTQIVSNMQNRSDNYSAAQAALDEVISNDRFFSNPSGVFLEPCSAQTPNTKCYSVNGGTTDDIAVTVKSSNDDSGPACIKARVIPTAQLDLGKEDDLGCSVGQAQTFGVAGAASGNSLCADSLWDIQAEAVDNVTGARVVSSVGVAVRVSADNIGSSCP